jgi:hypothetical protein
LERLEELFAIAGDFHRRSLELVVSGDGRIRRRRTSKFNASGESPGIGSLRFFFSNNSKNATAAAVDNVHL